MNFLLRILLHGLCLLLLMRSWTAESQEPYKRSNDFNKDWRLFVGDIQGAESVGFDDSRWRRLDLPHDASIEGAFDSRNPAGVHGGYLPTGAGFYRKVFLADKSLAGKCVFIDFDGVYRNSDVWINGHFLGRRPNGYISFRYELTDFLHYGSPNVILVKVDNFAQPGSRWYTGSGIYRNVRLTITGRVYIDLWGVSVTSPSVSRSSAKIHIVTSVRNSSAQAGRPGKMLTVKNTLFDRQGRIAGEVSSNIPCDSPLQQAEQEIISSAPHLWSDTDPYLYTLQTRIMDNTKVLDESRTVCGLRSFSFDENKGFILNGEQVKIRGVCNHHDLGCLGAAVNRSAIARQLRILKEMGCNAIRTAHNPPAPELLELCDEMGFIVMDEAFDVWEIAKTPFDYHWNWKEWHERDLRDQVLRDRNHPSIFIWSIGNELPEQSDPAGHGERIARELTQIIRSLDTTRPVTAANNHPDKSNPILTSGALELIGYNYRHTSWPGFHQRWPQGRFIATETVSALETRGSYPQPSTPIMRWGGDGFPVTRNPVDFTCPAYDQVSTPWGSTHEESLKIISKYDFLSGMFVWTGFDYLGEPTPYSWPARSSYFGIVDMAGFPKDVYYLYQSVWTQRPVLHLFPHWNWEEGQVVDVWAYYNNADEVELFLNGQSLGVRKKSGDDLHVVWRVAFHPGVLRAVSRRQGRVVLGKEIRTAGKAAAILLSSDKPSIRAHENELAFLTARVVDAAGNTVPYASDLLSFEVLGKADIAGVDNGNPLSHEPLKGRQIKAFNGLALAVIRGLKSSEKIIVTARSPGLAPTSLTLLAK